MPEPGEFSADEKGAGAVKSAARDWETEAVGTGERPRVSRRRFLAISAAATALPAAGPAAAAQIARWQGTALGGVASTTLIGIDAAAAAETFAAVEREIARLEDVFSLYLSNSALVRLNRSGRIETPPPELIEVLQLSDVLYRTTDGAFDPTIQPLWLLQAAAAAQGQRPTPGQVAAVRGRVGWGNLRFSPKEASFARAGMALTLNGIAQGFIADSVAALLRGRGLRDVLVDAGEVTASGSRADGTPWRAGIADPDGRVVRQIRLDGRGLAVSAPNGTRLGRETRAGHILDPRSGQPAERWRLVTVSAPSAALADGLSTAFCVLPRRAIRRALAAHPDASLEVLL